MYTKPCAYKNAIKQYAQPVGEILEVANERPRFTIKLIAKEAAIRAIDKDQEKAGNKEWFHLRHKRIKI